RGLPLVARRRLVAARPAARGRNGARSPARRRTAAPSASPFACATRSARSRQSGSPCAFANPRTIDPVDEGGTTQPLLTVVVPVYNGGDEIVGNVEHIREAIARGLAGEFEVVVVSDGSI